LDFNFINDDERGLHADYEDWLENVRSKLRQALHEPINRYRHNRTGEDNGDAHLKHQALQWITVHCDGPRGRRGDYRRAVGVWPVGAAFYGEFDGRRAKRVLVKIIGEEQRAVVLLGLVSLSPVVSSQMKTLPKGVRSLKR
jgi:thiamine phosphate synthase YjbQ (UPF0047 family)